MPLCSHSGLNPPGSVSFFLAAWGSPAASPPWQRRSPAATAHPQEDAPSACAAGGMENTAGIWGVMGGYGVKAAPQPPSHGFVAGGVLDAVRNISTAGFCRHGVPATCPPSSALSRTAQAVTFCCSLFCLLSQSWELILPLGLLLRAATSPQAGNYPASG